MSVAFENIPASEGVRKVSPGEGVPLHSHSSPEVFYILTGQIDFFRMMDGKEDWLRCETGSTVILPFATAMARVAEIGLQHNMYFAPYDRSEVATGLGNEDPTSQTLPQCARRRAHRDREVALAWR